MPERPAKQARLGRGLGALISHSGGHAEALGRILAHRRQQPLAGVLALLDEPPDFVSLMDSALCFLEDACRADLVAYYSVTGPMAGQFFYRLEEEVPFDAELLAQALETCRAEATSWRLCGGRPAFPSCLPAKSGRGEEGPMRQTTYCWRGRGWRGVFLVRSTQEDAPGFPAATLCGLLGRLMDLIEERSL